MSLGLSPWLSLGLTPSCPHRVDAPLPAGVRVKGDTLLFQRPLAVADAGDYVCRVSNRVAAKEARANVSIRGRATGGDRDRGTPGWAWQKGECGEGSAGLGCSMCLYVHLFVCLSDHPSIHPSIIYPSSIHPLSIHSFIHSSTHPSVHSSVHPFIHSSTHPSVHPHIHSFTHTPICPSVHPHTDSSTHPSVCPSLLRSSHPVPVPPRSIPLPRPSTHRVLTQPGFTHCLLTPALPSTHPPFHPLIRPSVPSSVLLSPHPSFCPLIHPSVHSSVLLSTPSSFCPLLHPSVRLPALLSTPLSFCPLTHPSVQSCALLSTHPPFRPLTHLVMPPDSCLSVHLSIHPSDIHPLLLSIPTHCPWIVHPSVCPSSHPWMSLSLHLILDAPPSICGHSSIHGWTRSSVHPSAHPWTCPSMDCPSVPLTPLTVHPHPLVTHRPTPPFGMSPDPFGVSPVLGCPLTPLGCPPISGCPLAPVGCPPGLGCPLWGVPAFRGAP
uniref:Immunoglobulin I-set domain-containing protein n=1 Tax=Junco hyemalis TaxID=40217 RepID=A0A8C5IDU7_JUNHY